MQRDKDGPVLVVGDLHEPFTHKDYLDFCVETYNLFYCSEVVFIGDIVDNHAFSFHDHDPDGMSPGGELARAQQSLAKWVTAFPKAKVCIGNHDGRIHNRAKKHGLPSSVLKPLMQIFDTPEWHYDLRHTISGVLYIHGKGYSGMNGHRRAAEINRQSTVIGHIHSHAGIAYLAAPLDLIWGMNVGCGIDVNAYAMAYAVDFDRKPILGCGVVYSKRMAYFMPMDLGDKR